MFFPLLPLLLRFDLVALDLCLLLCERFFAFVHSLWLQHWHLVFRSELDFLAWIWQCVGSAFASLWWPLAWTLFSVPPIPLFSVPVPKPRRHAAMLIRFTEPDAVCSLKKVASASASFRVAYLFLFALIFDSTLGFPGEGPNAPSTWSLVSANIGSLNSNLQWKTFDDVIVCLQETRVGKNNHRTSSFVVESTGRSLFHGGLMPGFIQKNGGSRLAHGGAAILGPKQLVLPFDASSDLTGLYHKIFLTKRAHAVWVQVTTNVRMLLFNIYARTGASSSDAILAENDALFADILQVVAQFGQIPVVLAGDFQHHPQNYPSIANAIHFQKWHDPLLSVDEEGQLDRPLTFSRDCTFAGLGEMCSSIDAVLLNDVAYVALKKMEVVATYESQHRPIRAEFCWPSIQQSGFSLIRPAAFDLTEASGLHTPDVEQRTASHWDQSFRHRFDHACSVDTKWELANRFAVDTLLSNGAKWDSGPKQRAKLPLFEKKTFCPGQMPNYGAQTRRGVSLRKTLRNMFELQCRLERPFGSAEDQYVTSRTIVKTWWKLHALGSPFLWEYRPCVSLVDVHNNVFWLKNQIVELEKHVKLLRIATWKVKIQQSAQQSKAYIFRHLRNKVIDDPPNLVTDELGNIIFQPNDAIASINCQWDAIFAANIDHAEPVRVLQFIWPYIEQNHDTCDLPVLSAEDLHTTIKARKPFAAPGLDGWRTEELQALPITTFQPFAQCFRHMEDSRMPLPKVLVCAKQMILNKNGDSAPLAKRLITVLPAILLAYTGARFRHLKPWQMVTMPRQLHGAIPGRQMTDIHTQLQLEVDKAHMANTPLLGVKLDKSKCFDRLIPGLVVGLCLAFGIPAFLGNFIARMYEGLHRHMSYKGWYAPEATTAPNGMAQGCSLSLLAINLYMKVWILLIERLPSITAHAFVDDSYLWASLTHADDLQVALQVTNLWDVLSGQATNEGKCTSWGTNRAARKKIKALFPDMKLQFAFDVLGALVNTTFAKRCSASKDKLEKVVTDIRNIAALPLPVDAKATLVSMKVTPQCSYAACQNAWPAQDLSKIQTELTKVFWGNRPQWRSKWLVLGALAKPHRIEPTLSGAFCGIRDFHRFLLSHPEWASDCVELLKHGPQIGIMFTVRMHFATFALQLHDDLSVSFGNGVRVPLLHFGKKDLAAVLIPLARHACYAAACNGKRKDFKKNKGVFDFDLTMTLLRHSKLTFQSGPPVRSHFQSVIVGCTLTRDRLAASSLIPSAQCRYCQEPHESLSHLVHVCPAWNTSRAKLHDHELGENFPLLGLVEHPRAVIEHRLKVSDPNMVLVQPRTSTELLELWSDGSLFWPRVFWLSAAGFALVDQYGSCVKRGPVCAWHLTSYSAELWAVVEACALATSKLHIFSDCKAVVQHLQDMILQNQVGKTWPHQNWWSFLLMLFRSKFQAVQGLQITWIPAHLFETIPCELVTNEMAASRGTSPKHVLLNRLVDVQAKLAAAEACAVSPDNDQWLYQAILQRQEWLTILNKEIGDERPPQEERDQLDARVAQNSDCIYPMWPWGAFLPDFPWRAKIPVDLEMPASFNTFRAFWPFFVRFMNGLHWRTGDFSTAYIELAVLFHQRGFTLQCCDVDTFTFKDLMSAMRKMCTAVKNLDNASFFPGEQTNATKSLGKTFPTGSLKGAIPWRSDEELLGLQQMCIDGAGQAFSSWSFPLREY